jgi:hypothetical protein
MYCIFIGGVAPHVIDDYSGTAMLKAMAWTRVFTYNFRSRVSWGRCSKEIEMYIIRDSSLAIIFARLTAAPVQTQSPTQGDYYAPGPATRLHATAADLKRNPQGDYYVGDKMILNAKRTAALKKCTDRIKFDSDRYVACMSKLGESP